MAKAVAEARQTARLLADAMAEVATRVADRMATVAGWWCGRCWPSWVPGYSGLAAPVGSSWPHRPRLPLLLREWSCTRPRTARMSALLCTRPQTPSSRVQTVPGHLTSGPACLVNLGLRTKLTGDGGLG